MTQTITFREYQTDIIHRSTEIIKQSGFLYLAMEVRTGKTLTSLGIASRLNVYNVLFITKKKAISSIENDYKALSPFYNLVVTNYESLHKIDPDIHWDLIICDEAHSMGAFPKPSNRAIAVKNLIVRHKPRVIFLSGTPTPESYSQMYHQVYGVPNNPFKEFKNFYRFCDVYVKLKERMINGLMIRDYSEGLETIIEKMKPYMINYTQAEAGFNSKTTEEVLEVELKESTYKLINRLKRDLVVTGKEEVILGDTPVKLMMKMHQMYSGTVKFESGNSMVIDDSKAVFIHDNFCNYKIGIFYKFKEELVVLKSVFGDDLTTELSVFEDTNKSIALQIVSGREGISLKQADFLVYYNIDFSATSYWQSKDRMTTKDRLENKVYWVFAKDGIENEIYKAVTKKKDYTVSHFKNDFYL
jgi:SNF2 family DNA or RNA helicase